MNWESVLSLLGGGVGVFVLKLYADWRKSKRGDTKDVVGAWQQIADRETSRLEKLEDRVTLLEKIVLEKELYIKQLERIILESGLKLPLGEYNGAKGTDGAGK